MFEAEKEKCLYYIKKCNCVLDKYGFDYDTKNHCVINYSEVSPYKVIRNLRQRLKNGEDSISLLVFYMNAKISYLQKLVILGEAENACVMV